MAVDSLLPGSEHCLGTEIHLLQEATKIARPVLSIAIESNDSLSRSQADALFQARSIPSVHRLTFHPHLRIVFETGGAVFRAGVIDHQYLVWSSQAIHLLADLSDHVGQSRLIEDRDDDGYPASLWILVHQKGLSVREEYFCAIPDSFAAGDHWARSYRQIFFHEGHAICSVRFSASATKGGCRGLHAFDRSIRLTWPTIWTSVRCDMQHGVGRWVATTNDDGEPSGQSG